ncbi:MAG: NADH-quinone oxidoreductase subunit H [Candidatus Fraserbacteria bacterium RBG_16_55_9]|uniref:NADH-quinone oxidoreductase subunit H n=1 Tax=Fraserbacteria sp. (strain RBG_16_55_9) TaxID=1817864 RepID=A0A1F5UPD7_FRAXR|nr:MAG: NADH-quinone oxidoreductase subunit H [Candidatus Fraserbacteria bacterium RBG_16_55_9]
MGPLWVVLAITAVKSLVVIVALLTAFAYMTWLERRLVSRFQVRIGPNRVGPFGLLQPVADGIKLFFKEDFMPSGADRALYFIAPGLAMVTAFTAFAVIPFGPPEVKLWGVPLLQIANPNAGILFILAVSSIGLYGIILGGWSSNSKYPLLGALRSSAQMISYELGVGLTLVSVILLSGTLQLPQIVEQQTLTWFGFLPRWNIFVIPVGPLAFLLFLIGATAETNRAPFDLPESEQELTAGYHTEYGGMKFAAFFVAEYVNLVTASAVAVTLFFGGWDGPFVDQVPLLGVLWFIAKVFAFVFFFIWLRATLPRVRYDQLMDLGWKLLVPLAILNLAITSAIVLIWPSLGGG